MWVPTFEDKIARIDNTSKGGGSSDECTRSNVNDYLHIFRGRCREIKGCRA